MLTGLTSPSSGEASIMGHDMQSDMDTIRRQMGYVPQHDTLFLALTVDENLAVFAGLKGVSTSHATDLLEKLGLEGSRNVAAKSLSGGQKRSLSVAIALIGKPKFLVLDEPTAGMDPVSRRRVWDVLLEHKSERITLLTTHFLDEADVLGDRIAILALVDYSALGPPCSSRLA
jgi:ABC-type multidrug transport system ATPase subunit